jgi:hypothetical protein
MDEIIASPTGRFEVRVSPWEARMSLWIETPAIFDKASGECLFSFEDSNWSLNSANWLSEAVVELRLRKYPGGHTPPEITLTIDCVAKIAQTEQERGLVRRNVEPALNRALTWPQPVENKPNTGIANLVRRLLSARRND